MVIFSESAIERTYIFLNETTALHKSFKVGPPDPNTKGDFEIVAAEKF